MLAQYKYKIKWHLLVIIPSEFFCRWILLLLSNFKPLPTTVIEVVHSPQECFIHGWEEGQTNKMSGTWVRTHPLLFRTIWQPYRLSYIHAFRINLSYKPKDQSLKFWWKNTESGFENLSYFESAILIKKNCFISIKTRHKLWERMDGTQLLLLSFVSSPKQPTPNILGGV